MATPNVLLAMSQSVIVTPESYLPVSDCGCVVVAGVLPGWETKREIGDVSDSVNIAHTDRLEVLVDSDVSSPILLHFT